MVGEGMGRRVRGYALQVLAKDCSDLNHVYSD